jgi:hypothetical protein
MASFTKLGAGVTESAAAVSEPLVSEGGGEEGLIEDMGSLHQGTVRRIKTQTFASHQNKMLNLFGIVPHPI